MYGRLYRLVQAQTAKVDAATPKYAAASARLIRGLEFFSSANFIGTPKFEVVAGPNIPC